jgi:hypothetical protein
MVLFFFGPSTITVSHIRGMINNVYFAEGMGCDPREETMLEPQPDEAMLFEEFFTARLWMPLYPILSDILLKFWVQIHQLTPNAIVQLSKYIWAVTIFGASLMLTASPRGMSCTTSQGKWKLTEQKCRGSTAALIFMPSTEVWG